MDTALAGKTYPTTSFEVDAEHVERFASAVGQTVPGVPPTFLTAAEFGVFDPIVSDPELGLDFSRVVHGDQEYVWHRPVVVGETLEVPLADRRHPRSEEATASSRSRSRCGAPAGSPSRRRARP